jgi:hypothetical protein
MCRAEYYLINIRIPCADRGREKERYGRNNFILITFLTSMCIYLHNITIHITELRSCLWDNSYEIQQVGEAIESYLEAIYFVRFWVLTDVSMNMIAFWDIVPCNLVEADRRFKDAF